MSRTESATLVCTEQLSRDHSPQVLARPYRELQVPVVLLAPHIDGECLRFTCCNVTNRSGRDRNPRSHPNVTHAPAALASAVTSVTVSDAACSTSNSPAKWLGGLIDSIES